MGLERIKAGKAESKQSGEAQKDRALSIIKGLDQDLRIELIGDVMETYCMCCGAEYDDEGDCPEGCDPEDLDGDEEDTDDEEGDDGDPDDVDDDEEDEEEASDE